MNKERKILNEFTPVIVKRKGNYYVGYIDTYYNDWDGKKYFVTIGHHRYLVIKCEDIIEIANKEFLIVENKINE